MSEAIQVEATSIEALKQQAEAAWAAKDHSGARAAYRALIEAGSESHAHALRLARACHSLGDSEGVEEALAALLQGPEKPARLVARSEVLLLLARPEEAVATLQAAASIAPLSLTGWRLLIRALKARGSPEDALDAAEEALTHHPTSLELKVSRLRLLTELAPEALQTQELDALVAAHPQEETAQALRLELLTRLKRPEAEVAARAYLEAYPGSKRARGALANQAFRQGEHAEAAKHFRLLLEGGSNNSSHAVHLARCHRALGDTAGVERALDLLQTCPSSAKRHQHAAEILRMLDRHQEAASALRGAAAMEPLSPQSWRLLIESLRQSDGLSAAVTAARQACAAFPEDLKLRLKRVELDAQRPDSDPKAVAAAAAALTAMHAEKPDPHLLRLRILKAQGDTTAARIAAQGFLCSLPEDRRAHLECARLAQAAKDYEGALEHYRTLASREPERCEHYVQIARCCNALGDMAGVVDSLVALERLPESALREFGRGQVLQVMHLYEDAIDAWKWALGLDPLHWGTWQALCQLLARLGRGDEALRLLDDLPPKHQGTPQAAMLYSHCASAIGHTETALRTLRDLGEAHSFASRLRLVHLLTNIDALEEAEAELVRCDPETAGQRAQLHMAFADIAGRRLDDKAMLAHCEAALEENPSAPAPLRKMANASMLAMNPQACLDYLTQSAEMAKGQGGNLIRPRLSVLGQLSTELLLDDEVTERLPGLMEAHDTTALSDLVRTSRSTGPAMALLITARRSGLLDAPATPRPVSLDGLQSPDAASVFAKIPAIIHQYWEGEMPDDVANAINRMRERNAWAEHRLYTRQTAMETLQAHGLERAAHAVRIARHPAERADILRLAILQISGGFYSDVDDLCLASLEPLAQPGVHYIGWQQNLEGTSGNNFLAALPSHPIIADALEEAVEETLSGGNESIWLRTGPGLLTRAFARHMARIGPEHFSRHHRFLTQGAMAPYLAFHRPLSYKLDQRSWIMAENLGGQRSIKELYEARRSTQKLQFAEAAS